MGETSIIEWTDSTWNPWRGCDKVDSACAYCYMFREQKHYGRDPSVVVRCSPPVFNAPLSPAWTRRRAECIADHGQHLVFTCSWSDWFHEDADAWRDEAWDVIRRSPGSTFQILTKRADRIADHLPDDWGDGWPNVWLGVTIGNRRGIWRADELRQVPAVVRFISAEPLLGPLFYDSDMGMARDRDWPHDVDDEFLGVPAHLRGDAYEPCWEDGADLPELDLTGIDWLIVGGESGGPPRRRLIGEDNQPRPERAQWVCDLRDACVECADCSQAGAGLSCGVHRGPAFLFKQWGGATAKSGGRLLDGRTWDELPEPAAVRA